MAAVPRLKAPPDAKLAYAVAALIPARPRATSANPQAGLHVGPAISVLAGPTPRDARPRPSPADVATATPPAKTVTRLKGVAGAVPAPFPLLLPYRSSRASSGPLAVDSGRANRQERGRDDPARQGLGHPTSSVRRAPRPSGRRPPRRPLEPDERLEDTRPPAVEVGVRREPFPGSYPVATRAGAAARLLHGGALLMVRRHPTEHDHAQRDMARVLVTAKVARPFAPHDLPRRGPRPLMAATAPRHTPAAACAPGRGRDAGKDRVPRQTGANAVEEAREGVREVGPDVGPDADVAKRAGHARPATPAPRAPTAPAMAHEDVASLPFSAYAFLPV